MQNLGQVLEQNIDPVIERWIEAVRCDRQIDGTDDLPDLEIRDHVPAVLQAIAALLSELAEQKETPEIREASLDHGVLRAQQGIDPASVVQEYRLLRQTVFAELESNLQTSSASEVLRVMQIVNRVIDQALSICFKSYVGERLRELEELRHQVALTTEELSRLVQSSKEQLSILAHELKTPLTSIIGYSELYLRQQQQQLQDTTSQASLENIERVLRNGRRLLHLVNQSLEFARYESSDVKLAPQSVTVAALLDSVIEVIEPLANQKGLRLIVDRDRAPEIVMTDPDRLLQVFINLCSNAVRYTQAGTVQLICIELSSEQWQIKVADTGVGISSENQTRIFTPYFQAATEERYGQKQGAGLGLAIVARIVQLLQGTIELTSQVGEGTTFIITFPRSLLAQD